MYFALLFIYLFIYFIDSSSGMTAVTPTDEPSGPRGKISTGGQNTNVVIQYPDTGLNLDQRVEMEPTGSAAAQDGVRPNLSGVLDAKTPSATDYRIHT